jgi:uncharacterized protein (TIGR02646 family)
MKIEKTPAPEFLQKNYKKWGRQFKAKLENPTKSNTFAWSTYKKLKVILRILPLLQAETSCHCSFCDAFPLETTGETIEHFRPKSKFPRLSYVWTNLFYCCNYCNGNKLENPERNLLKPDSNGYSFEKYFLFDYESGKIEANPALSPTEKTKANNTILIYGLNLFNRPFRRKFYLKQFQNMQNPDIEDFPYRFIFQ